MPTKASIKTVDMTNVKESSRSGINAKRVPEGDYLARIKSVADAPVKSGNNEGAFQWLFIIGLEDKPTASYPYYCQLAENQLWKVRNLLTASGINVPKKRLKLDPEKLVGKLIAVTMEDDEYEGKLKSVIAAVFPPAEMNAGAEEADEDEDEDEEDEDEEEEPEPAPVKKARKKTPPPVEDEEDEDEDEDEADEDEDEDEEEEPPPPPKRTKKVAAKAAPARRRKTRQVSDDELEELDIEDI